MIVDIADIILLVVVKHKESPGKFPELIWTRTNIFYKSQPLVRKPYVCVPLDD